MPTGILFFRHRLCIFLPTALFFLLLFVIFVSFHIRIDPGLAERPEALTVVQNKYGI